MQLSSKDFGFSRLEICSDLIFLLFFLSVHLGKYEFWIRLRQINYLSILNAFLFLLIAIFFCFFNCNCVLAKLTDQLVTIRLPWRRLLGSHVELVVK